MSGHNRIPTPIKFESLDCPVEAGEECVMPQRRGWGIDRSINPVYIGLLATTIIGILLWAGGEKGVNAHFQAVDTTLTQHTKDDQNTEKRVDRLEDRLKSIDEKLDRLIERRR